MALLQSGQPRILPSIPETRTVSIAQSGLVPTNAASLQFKVGGVSQTNFGVFLNGERISLFPLLSTNDYTLLGAPIERFAGQVAELRFTVFSPTERVYNDIGVDSFVFSPTVVPEPSTWALIALGGAVFCWATRFPKSN
jgi:hypothetical protein